MGLKKQTPQTKSKSFGLTNNVTINSKAFSHNLLGETSPVLRFREERLVNTGVSYSGNYQDGNNPTHHWSRRAIIDNISWDACSEQAWLSQAVAPGISVVTHHNLEIILTHWQHTGQQREKHEQIKCRNTNILYGEEWWVIPGHRAPSWPFVMKCSHELCHPPGSSVLITPWLFLRQQIGFGLHVCDMLWLARSLEDVHLQMCMFEIISKLGLSSFLIWWTSIVYATREPGDWLL